MFHFLVIASGKRVIQTRSRLAALPFTRYATASRAYHNATAKSKQGDLTVTVRCHPFSQRPVRKPIHHAHHWLTMSLPREPLGLRSSALASPVEDARGTGD
ncbi:MAG: hypothetical protein E6J34_18570 [Chloroflexi bacterium]|nr:MAG: hypothetical protein E6J34_18570 [Chloroflexota bacterium]